MSSSTREKFADCKNCQPVKLDNSENDAVTFSCYMLGLVVFIYRVLGFGLVLVFVGWCFFCGMGFLLLFCLAFCGGQNCLVLIMTEKRV